MNFFSSFLEEKILITFFKVIKLNRDLQELILEIIIDDIIMDELSVLNCSYVFEHELYETYEARNSDVYIESD